jgi:hypothetical protein
MKTNRLKVLRISATVRTALKLHPTHLPHSPQNQIKIKYNIINVIKIHLFICYRTFVLIIHGPDILAPTQEKDQEFVDVDWSKKVQKV